MNFVRIYDWDMRRLVIFVLSIQLSFISLTYLDPSDMLLLVVKQFLGFFILTFFPGLLILRILKLHLGAIKSLLFSVGLSLAFIILLGLSMNSLYQSIGFSKPISQFPIFFTINLCLIILLRIAYSAECNFISPINLQFKYSDLFNPYCLLSIFIFFLCIIGVYSANFFDNNMLLMIFILSISLIPVLVSINKIPNKFYPFIIFFVSLSLLYHNSLFSDFVIGTDIFKEINLADLTTINYSWNPSNGHILNSVLSITLVPSIFGVFCGFNSILYFKMISPFFFSLIPIGLYYIYDVNFRDKLSKNEIFLAVFFVMATFYFYSMMVGLGRQQIAELFYILCVMLLMDHEKIDTINYKFILILVSFSLIVSHYSLANLFFFFLILVVIFNSIFMIINNKRNENKVSSNYVLLFFVLTLFWYLYVANGSVFNITALMGETIYNSFSEFLEPQTTIAVNIATTSSPNIAHIIYRCFYYTVVLFISIGGINLLRTIIHSKKNKISIYELFAMANYSLLCLYIFVPSLGYQLGFNRIFHITSLILAPYMVSGFNISLTAASYLNRSFLKPLFNHFSLNRTKLLALFLSIFFLFNSGFLFEVLTDPFPNSIPLSLNINNLSKMDQNMGTMYLKVQTLTQNEVNSATWISNNYDSKKNLYAAFGSNELTISGIRTSYIDFKKLDGVNGYIYFNFINKILKYNIIKSSWQQETIQRINCSDLENLNKFNKVYSSSGVDIYRS